MGFRLNVVCSSRVSEAQRGDIFDSAQSIWDFIRGPRDIGDFDDRVVFAPPEMTSYLLRTDEDVETVIVQNNDLEAQLVDWSQQFPDITFAYIEADCFGGKCVYAGFCCINGRIILSQEPHLAGYIPLLQQIDFEVNSSYFAPFERGFFTGYGSGGFE